MNQNKIVSIVIGAIIIAGISFYVGTKVGGGSKLSAFNARNANFSGQFTGTTTGQRLGVNGRGGGVTAGEILSKDSQTLTLKLNDGSTKIILYSASTQVDKNVSGSASDLTNGANVMVTGSQNTNGSITAQMIQIRPATSVHNSSTTQNSN